METRLCNIFKSSYRVPQVTFKWKTLKQPVYFLKVVEFCPTFDIQIDITLAIFREKLQNYNFYKAQHSCQQGPPLRYNGSLKI